jgi:hypothetical protein
VARKEVEYVACGAQREGDPAPCANPVTANKRTGCPLHCSKPVKHRRDCGEDCRIRTVHGDRFCANPPMEGRDQCRLHGGKALRGAASPLFTHGGFSKDLPTNLAADFEEWRSDAERQEMYNEMGVLYARLKQLMRSLKENDTPAVWAGLRRAVAAWKAARAARDADGARAAIEQIEELIEKGFDDAPVWKEIHKTVELAGYIKGVQDKRDYRKAQVIRADQMMIVLARVVDIITTHVSDRRTLDAISRDIGLLVGAGRPALPAAVGLSGADEEYVDAELVEDAA